MIVGFGLLDTVLSLGGLALLVSAWRVLVHRETAAEGLPAGSPEMVRPIPCGPSAAPGFQGGTGGSPEQIEALVQPAEPAGQIPRSAHDALAGLVAKAPIIAWSRTADGALTWSGGTIATKAGPVGADEVTTILAARGVHGPGHAAENGNGGANGVEKSRVEITRPGSDGLPLHVVEIPGPEGTVLGYAVDATMAASAEATLGRFVQTMTETFAHLTVGLAIFDRNQTLAMFNPALVQMWQVEPSWLACRPSLKDIIETLRTNRRLPEVDNFHDWRSRLMRLFDDTDHAEYEEIWHLDDGSNIRVLARPHPHGSLAFVFDDVSERMKLEQRYRHSIDLRRSTLDRLDEGLAVFGPNGLLQFVNNAFHDIWGTDAETVTQQLHAREVIQLCRGASVETEAWERLIAFVTTEDIRRPWSTRLTLGSGRTLSLRVASLPDGASMAVFTDITDSERIALALRERNEALEAAEEMRSAVLDRISHRLRTPLNTIFGFGQLISDQRFGALSERQKSYASGILEAAGQLLDTIDDVTELAALQIDPLHDEIASQQLWSLFETTKALLQKRAIEAGAQIRLAEIPEGAEHISCDLPILRQIVFNLAAGALHRAVPGCEIELGARATASGTLEIFAVERGGKDENGDTGSPARAELSNLTRSLLKRQSERAGGTFDLFARPELNERTAVCRFPGLLEPLDPAVDLPVDDETDRGFEQVLGIETRDG